WGGDHLKMHIANPATTGHRQSGKRITTELGEEEVVHGQCQPARAPFRRSVREGSASRVTVARRFDSVAEGTGQIVHPPAQEWNGTVEATGETAPGSSQPRLRDVPDDALEMRGNQKLITTPTAIDKPGEFDHADVVETAQTGPQTAPDGVQVEIPVLAVSAG
ncbi:MAG: hypothetical protein ACJ8BC_11380, partial [Gemmatimonadales bacterium]